MAKALTNSESVPRRPNQALQSLERGFAVIQVFSREHPTLTLSDVARLTGITRATARRILLTLQDLGFVRSEGRMFYLTPKVMDLGWSYISSLSIEEIARPLMQDLVDELNESCSMATLDLPDVVYVARLHTRRITTIAGSVGSRMPAQSTAIGRVMLAGLPAEELQDYLTRWPLKRYTDRTIVERDRFLAALKQVADCGWAMVDQELEMGLRAVAVPVTGRDGRVFAGLSISSAAGRLSQDDLKHRCLPRLLEKARTISTALQRGAREFTRLG